MLPVHLGQVVGYQEEGMGVAMDQQQIDEKLDSVHVSAAHVIARKRRMSGKHFTKFALPATPPPLIARAAPLRLLSRYISELKAATERIWTLT